MLIAQALDRDLTLVTIEEGLSAYGVRRIWHKLGTWMDCLGLGPCAS